MTSVLRSYFLSQKQSYFPRPLKETEKHVISLVFHESDAGHKGYLSREDLKVATVSLFGYKPSKYEVDKMFFRGQAEEEELVMSLDSFMEVMSNKMSAKDDDEEIRSIFMAMDFHCHGFLSLTDLKRAFSQVAPHIPDHIIHAAFREIDRDGDGRVSYKDFEFMMKFNVDD